MYDFVDKAIESRAIGTLSKVSRSSVNTTSSKRTVQSGGYVTNYTKTNLSVMR